MPHRKLNAIFLDRFLQTAEMLKPSTPSASHDSTGSSGNDDGAEYYPHIGDPVMQKYKVFCNNQVDIKIKASPLQIPSSSVRPEQSQTG